MAIEPERVADAPEIELLLDEAFGPQRQNKTVYRLREGRSPVAELCTVVRDGAGSMRGSLRFWEIRAGLAEPALLLGPIAVRPGDRGVGYGRALMWHGLAEAKRLGYAYVVLVGDEPYYGQFGFSRDVARRLALPGPVDSHRLLGLVLKPGAEELAVGMIVPVDADKSDLAAPGV